MLSMPLLHGIIITWKRTWSQSFKGVNATVPPLVLFMQTFRLLYLVFLFVFFFFEKHNKRVLVGCKRFSLGSFSIRCATARRFPPHLTSLRPRRALLRKRARLHTPREIICSKRT